MTCSVQKSLTSALCKGKLTKADVYVEINVCYGIIVIQCTTTIFICVLQVTFYKGEKKIDV